MIGDIVPMNRVALGSIGIQAGVHYSFESKVKTIDTCHAPAGGIDNTQIARIGQHHVSGRKDSQVLTIVGDGRTDGAEVKIPPDEIIIAELIEVFADHGE